MQTAGGVSQVHQPASINKYVGGGDRPCGAQSRWWRWDKCRDLFWTERIGNTEHAQARILIRHEDDFRALEATLSIFMHVMCPELATELAIVLLGRHRKCGDRDGIALLANVEDPHVLGPIRTVLEDGFVSLDQQVTIRQWQRGVCATTERRTPVAMCQQHGMRRIVHVDDRQSTVTP